MRNPSSSALTGDNSDMKLDTTAEGREKGHESTQASSAPDLSARTGRNTTFLGTVSVNLE